MGAFVLMTERLTLRPLRADDAEAVTEKVDDFEIVRWLSSVAWPVTRDDTDQFIAGAGAAPGMTWAIEDHWGLSGIISLREELGYWIARDRWGRGYAQEAAEAVIADAFADPDRESVLTSHFRDNTASRNVLTKLGFKDDGTKEIEALALGKSVPAQKMRLSRENWDLRDRFVIETKRLVLRPFTTEDAPALAALVTPAVARMLGSFPSDVSETVARDFIEARVWTGGVDRQLAVTDTNGHLIGSVGVGGKPSSVMVFLHPHRQGRGYGTEALGALIKAVFARHPLSELTASRFAENTKAERVLTKLGFLATGEGIGRSRARVEPAPIVKYRLLRSDFRMPE